MFGVKELLLLVFATSQVMSRDTDYCYAYNDHPYLKFATRTAYHFIHGVNTPLYQSIPHCKPVQIWMLVRHGTKYPEANIIRRMKHLSNLRDVIIENHEVRGYGHLCDADLKNLRMWHLDPTVQLDYAEVLTEQGVKDLNLLGKRIKSYFPELFPPLISNVSSSNYKFRLANEGPMISSEKAFMSGVLDRVDIPDAEIPENDTLFLSYRDCPGWHDKVADNAEVQAEVISFAVGPEMQSLILNISRRLGFSKNITVDLVVDMWNMCRFDKAWNITALSPWCAVFSDNELKVLEYNATLNDYYTRGPGHELNQRLGCPQMQHLFRHFEKLEDDSYSKEPKGIFNVGGSRSLHLFMAAMGFAKDPTPPLASEFQLMNKQRWSTSDIGPFAANIAAVFYKCNDTESQNKVMFYQNEKIVYYEGCNAGFCDWEYLKNKFPNATSDCNFDFCHLESSA